MIYLHDSDGNYYTAEGNFEIKNDMPYYSYHVPYTAQNYAKTLGVNLQELSVQIYQESRTTIPWHKIDKVSFDNWNTYQTVFAATSLGFVEPPSGWTYSIQVELLVSPIRYGASHTSGNLWGLTSVTLTTNGNHEATAKITYKGAQYYFPLDANLLAHNGEALIYTRSGTVTHDGISYSANTPIFDEGLYFTGNENTKLTLTKTYTEYMLGLIVRYKGGDAVGTILSFLGATLFWDDEEILLLSVPGGDYDVRFPWQDYESGKPVMILLKHKSDGTNTLLCGVYDETTHKLVSPASISFTDTTFNDLTGDVYIGYDGGTDIISGHSISDIILYDYTITDPSTVEWNLTTEPLQFNDFHIPNINSGTITYRDGKLTDEDGNDITGLASGTIVTEGTIEMKDGLSGLWSVEVQDAYLP